MTGKRSRSNGAGRGIGELSLQRETVRELSARGALVERGPARREFKTLISSLGENTYAGLWGKGDDRLADGRGLHQPFTMFAAPVANSVSHIRVEPIVTNSTIEPLDPITWLDKLARLHSEAMGTEERPTDSFIRQAFHLTKLAPGPYRDLLPVDVDEERVEAMLECGAHESAMMALIKPETPFQVQKPRGAERFSAQVAIDTQAPLGQSSHKVCGKAILCAWLCSLAHIAGIDLAGGVTDPGQRKSRCGSPRSSTAH